MPKVSVIVPCFNVAPWLKRCLDSLINQTLQDIEIICVDDKSSDNTLNILQQYAKQDPRIKVIAHKSNAGEAASRNTGIANATGKYVGFVDSDDAVEPDFYKTLYDLAIDNNADIAKGIIKIFSPDGLTTETSNNKITTPCNKFNFKTGFSTAIYSKAFLDMHKIDFPVGILISADTNFLAQCICNAKKVIFTNNVAYLYYRRDNSMDSRALSDAKLISGLQSVCMLIDWANNNKKLTDEEYAHAISCAIFMFKYLAKKKLPCGGLLHIQNTTEFIYKNTRKPELFISLFGTKVADAVSTQNYSKLHKYLCTTKVRYRLFSKIPFLAIANTADYIKTALLFECIPIFKVKHNENISQIYVCGILFLRIKR